MSRSRGPEFHASEGLFDDLERQRNDLKETQQVQPVQEVQEEKVKVIYGHTQGKKGHKVKRINMGFSDENHEYITMESRRRGMSASAFVNMIIEEHSKK